MTSASHTPNNGRSKTRLQPPPAAMDPASPGGASLVSFMLRADTGELVGVTGAVAMAPEPGTPASVEALVQQAFEAGLACVLGGGPEREEETGSAEDEAVRRFLLETLIEKSPARHLLRREIVRRAILGTLADGAAALHGAAAGGAPPEGEAAH